jgi:toxin ParE1/3/4
VIRWTDEARADVIGFTNWLHERNPASAARVAEDVLISIEVLDQFPHCGRTGRVADTREPVVARRPYVVIYRVIQGDVVILRVVHDARLWPPQDDADD